MRLAVLRVRVGAAAPLATLVSSCAVSRAVHLASHICPAKGCVQYSQSLLPPLLLPLPTQLLLPSLLLLHASPLLPLLLLRYDHHLLCRCRFGNLQSDGLVCE
jgi:hypothetical protein